jgi:glyoxylase-like metal-dependent hydrolase (beta-lactamase superfamily II)/rhodanese-related sulfurtransferase
MKIEKKEIIETMERTSLILAGCFLALLLAFSHAAEIKDTETSSHTIDSSVSRVLETYSFPDFKIVQFSLPVLSIYSYILISDGEALMVDPVRDITPYLDFAKKEGVTIKGIYLTHSHADFVAGHKEMVKALNCPIYQSHLSGARYQTKPLDESTELKIGKAVLKFIETPGHTPDGMCCVAYSSDKPDTPLALFTGDYLFVGSVGRPDLLEGKVSAAWLAGASFDSWTNKVSKLPDAVQIFPAHGAGSLCGAHLSDEPSSTIGKERTSNPYLTRTRRSEFIAAVLEELPEAPQYFKYNAKMNREGPPLVKWDAPLPKDKRSSMELANSAKYYLVDVRDPQEYAKGHIQNSVNIGIRGRFETWVGSMVPWGSKLILFGTEPELKEALFRLHRIGYKGDVLRTDAWKKAKLPLMVNPPISPKELHGLMKKGEAPLIVDVRLPAEWIALKIGTVLNLPLTSLAERSVLLDPQAPVIVVCNSAYRSSLAAGILERKGFKNVRSLEGGSQAWIDEGLPVIEPTEKR